MSPLYTTSSDVLAYPKVSTKTLVYPPFQEASCRQINFCLLFMPNVYCKSILLLPKLFMYLDCQWSGQESMTGF